MLRLPGKFISCLNLHHAFVDSLSSYNHELQASHYDDDDDDDDDDDGDDDDDDDDDI